MKVNYTEEMTAEIIAEYEANPCKETVDAIAERIGKTARSVIAKLSSAGVYRTPQRTTKTGDAIVKKDELVAEIETWLGLPEGSVPSLAKTSKLELKQVHAAIKELALDVEEGVLDSTSD